MRSELFHLHCSLLSLHGFWQLLSLSYDGILKERISIAEKAVLRIKQHLSFPDIHYSNGKEKNKVIELPEKFVKNSLAIHLKKDEKKGYMQEIVSLPEYEKE